MPSLGRIDPADLEAKARAEAGLCRVEKVVRRSVPHPGRGGSSGYDEWYREEQLQKWSNGELVDASRASLYRWEKRRERYRRSGNGDRSVLVGIDLVNLVTFLLAHPDATIDEMAAFIYNEGGELYDRRRIQARLSELEVTKKKASTEAYQALTPNNQFNAWMFWNSRPPLGVKNVPRRTLIDVDEFGLTLEKCNRTGGWALKCFRVRKDGHYKFGLKVTALMAIEPGDPRLPPQMSGSVENPRRWVRTIQTGGTTTIVFRDFVNHICSDIESAPIMGYQDAQGNNVVTNTDQRRTFLWDNLSSHHSAYVNQTVYGRNGPCRFTIVPRPPYQPKWGPIEYKICDLTNAIRLVKDETWDFGRLEVAIHQKAAEIGPFNSTFEHCGYKWV